MQRHNGGQRVTRGVYLDLTSVDLFQCPEQGAVLPGDHNTSYLEIPAPVAFAAAPLLGLTYIIFLPVLGIAGLISFAMHRLVRALLPSGAEMGRMAVPAWVPGVSYLVRGRRAAQPAAAEGEPADAAEEFLDDVEEKLQQRRRDGER